MFGVSGLSALGRLQRPTTLPVALYSTLLVVVGVSQSSYKPTVRDGKPITAWTSSRVCPSLTCSNGLVAGCSARSVAPRVVVKRSIPTRRIGLYILNRPPALLGYPRRNVRIQNELSEIRSQQIG